MAAPSQYCDYGIVDVAPAHHHPPGGRMHRLVIIQYKHFKK
ncbi:hypothetical protein SAMN05216308_12518 [Nitrosospira sp. Nsp13]|nr:hypothetical protein SAMN05216308_12518 [Nitrosospira sp. Nsp13]